MQHLGSLRRDRLVSGVHYKPNHVSGMCLLLSRDVVDDLSLRRDRLDYYAPDDHAIAVYLLQHRSDPVEYQSLSATRCSPVGSHGCRRPPRCSPRSMPSER